MVVSDGAAAVPMTFPAVAEAVPQVDIKRGTALAVIPLAEEMTLYVALVGLSEDGRDRPAVLLDSKSGCCFMDVGVLVP